jgi:hypothetical protein
MTQTISDTVNLTIQEYAAVFPTAKRKYTEEQLIDWARVEGKLQNEMEWTPEGAAHIAALARDYGAFVLRNAMALAISLGIEDGDSGL